MRQLVVLAIFVAAASAGTWTSGLRVRFTTNILSLGTAGFYDIPKNLTAATGEGWTEATRPDDSPLSSLTLYCVTNLTLCGLFDADGYISGLQIALDTSDFTGQPYDWEQLGFTSWTPSDDGKTYWTIQQYFVDSDYLSKSDTERAELRAYNPVLPLDGLWLTGNNQELLKVSNSSDDIADSVFTEQASIPFMGRHWYYKMTANTTCDSTLYSWFPLTDDGQLVGTGFVTFGTYPENPVKDYFERPSRSAVETIVPNGPECLYELADSPGVLTMHIYYVDQPWYITFNN